MSDLANKTCKACEGIEGKLSEEMVQQNLKAVPEWAVQNGALVRVFKFKNYHEVMAFVNATAWISHRENHHPDMEVGYNKVTMRYVTHALGGLSENDFICAAKVNELLDTAPEL